MSKYSNSKQTLIDYINTITELEAIELLIEFKEYLEPTGYSTHCKSPGSGTKRDPQILTDLQYEGVAKFTRLHP